MYADQMLPQAMEAEEAVLGSVLISPGRLSDVVGMGLKQGDFVREKHGLIWAAIMDVYTDNREPNQIVVAQELKLHGQTETAATLGLLLANTPNSTSIVHYAEIVLETARKRAVIAAGGLIVADGYNGTPSAEIIQQGVNNLMRIQRQTAVKKPMSATELYEEYQADIIEELDQDENYTRGFSTGFRDLDRTVGGWEDGLFYVIGSRTSIGKTTFAAGCLLSVALAGGSVFCFTLETTRKQMLERMVYGLAGVNRQQYARMPADQREVQKDQVMDALNLFDQLPITILDQRGINPTNIRGVLQSHIQTFGKPKLVVVDYLNLIGSERARGSQYEQVSQTVRDLKDVGGELEVPMMVMAQLNRAPEARADGARRPSMSDFRDSGAIEEVASTLMGLYRESYYYPTSIEQGNWEKKNPGMRFPHNTMEIHVLKQQLAATGMVKLFCDMSTGKMADLGRDPGETGTRG